MSQYDRRPPRRDDESRHAKRQPAQRTAVSPRSQDARSDVSMLSDDRQPTGRPTTMSLPTRSRPVYGSSGRDEDSVVSRVTTSTVPPSARYSVYDSTARTPSYRGTVTSRSTAPNPTRTTQFNVNADIDHHGSEPHNRPSGTSPPQSKAIHYDQPTNITGTFASDSEAMNQKQPPRTRASESYRHDLQREETDLAMIAAQVQNFVDAVPSDDWRACAEFINKHPTILTHPAVYNLLLSRAEQTLRIKQPDIARNCVEKATIVKSCCGKARAETTEFFRDLYRGGKHAHRKFLAEVDKKFAELEQRVDFLKHPDTGHPAGSFPQQYHTQTQSRQVPPSEVHTSDRIPRQAVPTYMPQSTQRTPTAYANPDLNPYPDQENSTMSFTQLISRRNPSEYGGSLYSPPRATQGLSDDENMTQDISSRQRTSTSKRRRTEDADPNHGDAERLDPSWSVQRPDWFKPGRVFSMLWHDSMSDRPSARGRDSASMDSTIIIGRYGEPISTTVRRVVVVKALYGSSIVVPITAYGGQGLRRGNLSRNEIQAHAIVYDVDTQPPSLQNEPQLSKKPISMQINPDVNKLAPSSLINFAKFTTVEHNVKVKDIGFISEESLPYVIAYWTQQVNQ